MGASLSLTLSESSVNTAANTSVVTAVLKVKSTNGTYNQQDSCTGTITIDGTSYSFKHYFAKNTTTTLATKSKTVTHNADGSKTVSVSAKYKTGVSPGTISTSKSITLTKINRYFTVYLDSQGGSAVSSPLTKTYGYALGLPSPTKTGYTFGGWCTGTGGGGTNYNTTYTSESGATLYAYWKENTATLTYNNGGHGTAPAAVTMRYTAATTAASISAVGYTFQGWKRSDDGTIIQEGDVVKAANVIPSSLTLTAQWEANTYDVSFNANGAEGEVPQTIVATYDSNITLPSGESLTKQGYTFKGWSAVANTEAPQYLEDSTILWNIDKDTVLYAVWSPTIINIRYYRTALERNFSDPNSYVELYVGTTIQYTSYTIENITAPDITNYTFTGYWTTEKPNSKVYTEYGVSFPAGIVPYDYTNSDLEAEGFLKFGSVLNQVIDTVYVYPIYKDNTISLVSPYTSLYNYISDAITVQMYFQYASGQLSTIPLSVVDDDLAACAVFRTAIGASGVSLDLSTITATLISVSDEQPIEINLDTVYFNKVTNLNSNTSDLFVVYRTTGTTGGKLVDPDTTEYTLTISGVKDSFGKSLPSVTINIYPPKIIRDINKNGDVIAFFEEAVDYSQVEKEDHPENEIWNQGIMFSNDFFLRMPEYETSSTLDNSLYTVISALGWFDVMNNL